MLVSIVWPNVSRKADTCFLVFLNGIQFVGPGISRLSYREMFGRCGVPIKSSDRRFRLGDSNDTILCRLWPGNGILPKVKGNGMKQYNGFRQNWLRIPAPTKSDEKSVIPETKHVSWTREKFSNAKKLKGLIFTNGAINLKALLFVAKF